MYPPKREDVVPGCGPASRSHYLTGTALLQYAITPTVTYRLQTVHASCSYLCSSMNTTHPLRSTPSERPSTSRDGYTQKDGYAMYRVILPIIATFSCLNRVSALRIRRAAPLPLALPPARCRDLAAELVSAASTAPKSSRSMVNQEPSVDRKLVIVTAQSPSAYQQGTSQSTYSTQRPLCFIVRWQYLHLIFVSDDISAGDSALLCLLTCIVVHSGSRMHSAHFDRQSRWHDLDQTPRLA